jgi:hypothetical protein
MMTSSPNGSLELATRILNARREGDKMFGGRKWDKRALDRLDAKNEEAEKYAPPGFTEDADNDVHRAVLWARQELIIIASHLWYANEQLRKIKSETGWGAVFSFFALIVLVLIWFSLQSIDHDIRALRSGD